MWMQFYAITRNTLSEAIRQPIFALLIIIGVLLLTMNVFLSSYTLDDDNLMLISMGLSTQLLMGLFMAAMLATATIYKEIEKRTIQVVLSKPIPRPVFILGKFIGTIAAVTMGQYILGLVFLMTVRHEVMQSATQSMDGPVLLAGLGSFLVSFIIAVANNYLYRRPFPSTFAKSMAILLTLGYLFVLLMNPNWQWQSITREFRSSKDISLWQVMLSLCLAIQSVWLFSAIAIACSTRLKGAATLAICAAAWILGLMSESVLHPFILNYDSASFGSIEGPIRFGMAQFFYQILPNFQYLWHADALVSRYTLSLSHTLWASSYGLVHTAAYLSLAAGLFYQREVG